jgi:pimeloyl-ACP methyl ester carboxylesterase
MANMHVNGVDLHVSRFRSAGPAAGADGGDGRPDGASTIAGFDAGATSDHRPIVVGIHGLGIVDSSSLSMSLGMHLAKFFDVVLYDLRGHGRSELVTSGFKVANHVEDFVALMDALGIDEPVHVLGGSYGSSVAITLAVEVPERVASISLIDPQFPLPDWGDTLAKILEHYGQLIYADDPVEALCEAFNTTARRRAGLLVKRGRRLLEETSILEEVRSEESLSIEQYAGISCPVMAVFGEDSEIYILSLVLKELIKSAEIVTLPGTDHIMSFHRPQTREAIVDFVERAEARPGGGEREDGRRAGQQR